MQKRTRILAIAAGLSVAAIGFSQTVQAPKESGKTQDTKKAVQPPAAAPGMIIAVDPVTKEIRQPTAAEIQALGAGQSALTTPPSPPQQFTTPSGAVVATLPASSMSYMVVTRTADGKLKMDCVTGTDAAKKAIQGTPTPVAGTVMTRKEKADDH